MAVILAVLILVSLAGPLPARRGWSVLISGAAALIVASPQLVAMAAQAGSKGGTSIDPHLLAVTSKIYGVSIGNLFAPTQRVGHYGLHNVAAWSYTSQQKGRIGESMPMFGLVLSLLAVCGLAVNWRRRSAWQLAALWLGCAWLALGASLWVMNVQHLPLQQVWNGVRVSPVMPYTWVMRTPVLSGSGRRTGSPSWAWLVPPCWPARQWNGCGITPGR